MISSYFGPHFAILPCILSLLPEPQLAKAFVAAAQHCSQFLASAVCLRIDDFATSDQMDAKEKSRPV